MNAFQILNSNNIPISLGELDKEAAEFWNIDISDRYVTPNQRTDSWFQSIGAVISQMSEGKHEWFDVIGKLCGIAAIGETSFLAILDAITYYEPYIDLCLYWNSKGYTPVTI